MITEGGFEGSPYSLLAEDEADFGFFFFFFADEVALAAVLGFGELTSETFRLLPEMCVEDEEGFLKLPAPEEEADRPCAPPPPPRFEAEDETDLL